jgi:hypothetical protein
MKERGFSASLIKKFVDEKVSTIAYIEELNWIQFECQNRPIQVKP